MLTTLAILIQLSNIEIRFNPVPEHAIASAGRLWSRQDVVLCGTKPDSIMREPELSRPLYGRVTFASGEFERTYDVILDMPEGQTTKDAFGKEIQKVIFYIDENRNGDLTDDVVIQPQVSVLDDHRETDHSFSWSCKLPVYQGGQLINGAVLFEYYVAGHSWFKGDGQLKFITDFGLTGEAKIGNKIYKAALRDIGPRAYYGGYDGRQAYLWLDRDDDGKLDYTYEGFNINESFCIEGQTYRIEVADPTGSRLLLIPTNEAKLEKPVPSTFIPKVGKVMPTFYVQTVDGKGVQIPGGYRGKLVLLDYWATWCGPCLTEAPNLVESVRKYGGPDLEVLGISLDDPDKGAEIIKTAQKHRLAWPHAYDGLAWKSPVVVNMRVTEIPNAFLVDGETGVILAMGDDLHGKKLGPTLKKFLEAKRAKASPAATP